MPEVAIRTTDKAWARRNKAPASKSRQGCYVLTVRAVEPLVFAGADMIRFRLNDVPSDWGNRWAQLPVSYLESTS
jgi:hypothetical protein